MPIPVQSQLPPIPDTVVVLLDGSARAEQSLPLAEALVRGPHARLVLVRAVSAPLFTSLEDERRLAQEAQRYVARVRVRMSTPSRVLTEVLCGDPAGALVESACRHKADLVVMTSLPSHHHRRASVPPAVYPILARLPVPVLVAQPFNAIAAVAQLRHHPRILVPLDGSRFAEAVLTLATALALGLDGKLVLARAVAAVDPVIATDVYGLGVPAPGLDRAAAHSYLDTVAQHIADVQPSGTPRIDVRLGLAAPVIRNIADEQDVAAIVMATHAHSRLRRVLLGSVTAEVVRDAQVPVVLIRPQALAPEPATWTEATQTSDNPCTAWAG